MSSIQNQTPQVGRQLDGDATEPSTRPMCRHALCIRAENCASLRCPVSLVFARSLRAPRRRGNCRKLTSCSLASSSGVVRVSGGFIQLSKSLPANNRRVLLPSGINANPPPLRVPSLQGVDLTIETQARHLLQARRSLHRHARIVGKLDVSFALGDGVRLMRRRGTRRVSWQLSLPSSLRRSWGSRSTGRGMHHHQRRA